MVGIGASTLALLFSAPSSRYPIFRVAGLILGLLSLVGWLAATFFAPLFANQFVR
jgi:hypothetical protein